MGGKALIWAISAILATGFSTAAAASDSATAGADLELARQMFREGVKAQDAGRYTQALEFYGRARTIAVSPPLLFNMAACREQLGELVEAVDEYRAALAAAETRGDADVEREARTKVAHVGARIPHVAVRLSKVVAPLTATLDGKAIPLASLVNLQTNPGQHRLVLRSTTPARAFEVAFELAPGMQRTLDVDLGPWTAEPPAIRPSAPPDARPHAIYWPSLLAGGAALAFGAGALWTGLASQDRWEQFNSLNATPKNSNQAEREDLVSSGHALQAANAVLLGATAVTVAAAVYLVLRPPRHSGTAARGVRLDPTGLRVGGWTAGLQF